MRPLFKEHYILIGLAVLALALFSVWYIGFSDTTPTVDGVIPQEIRVLESEE